MPAGQPATIGAELVDALAADFDPRDRLSGRQDRLNDLFDMIGEIGHDVAHRSPDMVGDRNSAHFGQTLIDLQVAAIRRNACEPDRGSIVDQLKIGKRCARSGAAVHRHWRGRAEHPRIDSHALSCGARLSGLTHRRPSNVACSALRGTYSPARHRGAWRTAVGCAWQSSWVDFPCPIADLRPRGSHRLNTTPPIDAPAPAAPA